MKEKYDAMVCMCLIVCVTVVLCFAMVFLTGCTCGLAY